VPRIDIDEEVFGHLQSHAVAYVETPNDTLRRLLGVGVSLPEAPAEHTIAPSLVVSARPAARKRAKANLGTLIRAGLLRNGQKLFLHDYSGNKVRGAEATIAGDAVWPTDRRRAYSMSDLAQELLKAEGYHSDSVRGPSHWYTHDGKSVTQLWGEYLESKR
jgi:hypothetical protein